MIKRTSVQASILEDKFEVQENFASCIFTVRFKANFQFHYIYDGSFNEHYTFAQIIQHVILEEWNWEKEKERQRNERINDIHSNIIKIFSLMKEGSTRDKVV